MSPLSSAVFHLSTAVSELCIYSGYHSYHYYLSWEISRWNLVKHFVFLLSTIVSRVNNIRREYLTPYRAVKYDCVKLKGFPCDV